MRLLISTGEVSGDLQGSLLIEALHRQARKCQLPLEIIALGGRRIKKKKANLIADTSSIGAIGLIEALPFVIPTLKVQSMLDDLLKKDPPDGVILIDYMGPNIRLGNQFRQRYPSVPIVYYIAPQEWAWRLGNGGTTDLIDFSDRILAIFKAEADFYSNRGGKVSWVGHPMIDTVKDLPERTEALNSLGIPVSKKVLLLLPASRSQELKYLMPTLVESALLLQKSDPSIYVLVAAGMDRFELPLRQYLSRYGIEGKVISAKEIDALKPTIFAASDLALAKSGTINMELAINNVPQIVGYRVSRITGLIARRILRFNVDHISPVNLILKKRLVPELVQEEFSAETIVELAKGLLYDNSIRASMLEGYKELKQNLGSPGATDRAAKEILQLVNS